jgi:hypothetical protein
MLTVGKDGQVHPPFFIYATQAKIESNLSLKLGAVSGLPEVFLDVKENGAGEFHPSTVALQEKGSMTGPLFRQWMLNVRSHFNEEDPLFIQVRPQQVALFAFTGGRLTGVRLRVAHSWTADQGVWSWRRSDSPRNCTSRSSRAAPTPLPSASRLTRCSAHSRRCSTSPPTSSRPRA